MNSPWQVLEIPSGSPVAVIKKAYAKLLRQHRPDVDPVGFRRLRDAYEVALAWAESGEPIADADGFDAATEFVWFEPNVPFAPATPSPTVPQPPVDTPTMGSRPRDLALSLREAMARERSGDRPQRLDRLARLLAKLLQQSDSGPALAQLACEEMGHDGSPMRLHLQLGRYYGSWNVDGLPLSRTLLLAHIAARDFDRLWSSVDELEGLVEASADPIVVTQAVDAVPVLALLDPVRASELADVVFQRASPGLRQFLGTTEVWVQAGRQLRERHLEQARPQFALALCDPRVGDDHPTALRAIELVVKAPRAPLVANLLAERFPTAWPQFEPEWRRARIRLGKRPAAVKEGGRDWRLVFWLMICLSILARFLIAWGSSNPSIPRIRIFRVERHPSGWNSSTGAPDGKR